MLLFHHMSQVIIVFLLLSIIGGTNAPLVKNGLKDFAPSTLVFLRFALASLILLPFVLKEKIIFKGNFKLLLLGGFAMAANVILYAVGLQYTSVAVSQLIFVPKALVVSLLAYIFLKETISKNKKLGLLFTMAGMSILVYGSYQTQDVLSFGKPIGNLLIMVGFLFSCSFYVISRKISKDYSPLTITFFSFVVATIMSSPFALFEYSSANHISGQITTLSILNLMALAVFSSIIVYYLSQYLIKHASTYIAALTLYMNFLIAGVAGIIFFSEKITLSLIIAACLIIFGVYIATKDEK